MMILSDSTDTGTFSIAEAWETRRQLLTCLPIQRITLNPLEMETTGLAFKRFPGYIRVYNGFMAAV